MRVRNIMRVGSIMRFRNIMRVRSLALVDGILNHFDCLFLALSKAEEYRIVS